MYEVSKEHRFEAAHRLVQGYPGNCKHLHGHSWIVRFHAQADELNNFGMAMDFADFKPIRQWIDDNLDHATLVSKDDEALLTFLGSNDQRLYTFESNPTSEHLAKFILEMCHELGLKDVCAVEIYETCTSRALYHG